jgi:hypothetical protein
VIQSRTLRRRDRRDAERGAFTFIEILLATLVLALSATATAYWMETVSNLAADADEQTIGSSLVKVVEALAGGKSFREPGTTRLGPESGETPETYDDFDDFHELVANPPIGPDGKTLTEYPDWTVRCVVEEFTFDPPPDAPPMEMSGGISELRSMTIVVEHHAREVARGYLLRARSPFE